MNLVVPLDQLLSHAKLIPNVVTLATPMTAALLLDVVNVIHSHQEHTW